MNLFTNDGYMATTEDVLNRFKVWVNANPHSKHSYSGLPEETILKFELLYLAAIIDWLTIASGPNSELLKNKKEELSKNYFRESHKTLNIDFGRCTGKTTVCEFLTIEFFESFVLATVNMIRDPENKSKIMLIDDCSPLQKIHRALNEAGSDQYVINFTNNQYKI